ncbi:MAG: hypothetical protein H0T53_12505 [Herpetosiphonaceae bacterium]|nr:hypothetical protein [Herpetosiphonaceae bacterium]
MLTLKDFIPQVQKKLLGIPTDYESIHEVLTRVKRWIDREQIQVLNVETLLLPMLPSEGEESPPARMNSVGNSMSTFQIIRVWYQEPPAAESAYTGITSRLSDHE